MSDEIQCQRCGKCCLTNMFAYVQQDDINRWRAQGRSDILALIEEPIWAGDRIVARANGHSLAGCPFLIQEETSAACAIYATRPAVCRDFKPASSPLCPQWKSQSSS